MKQRKGAMGQGLEAMDAKSAADSYLNEIIVRAAEIKAIQDECDAAMQEVTARYALRIEARNGLLESAIKALMQTMKFNKKVLFDGTDVVNLPHGSLIHNKADHVSIPKTALLACEQQGFNDVIKTVKSLDRDAIEQWPDAKLLLIGATRNPKEEFKYSLKQKED